MSRNNTNTNSSNGATEFIQLTDCPDTHNPPNAYVVTNNTGTAISYNTAPPSGATKFVQLTDAPASITPNEYVVGNSSGTALIFSSAPPSESFLDLTDVPHSYTGQANKTVQVNSGETGLVFNAINNPQSFIQLSDTPNSYAGQANNLVQVNTGETALQFVSQSSIIPTLITQLTDCPSVLVANDFLKVNSGGSAVECVSQYIPVNFDQLLDCPNSYVGQANKICAVNSIETGIDFVSPTFAEAFIDLIDVPNSYAGAGGEYVKVKSTEDGLEFVAGGSGSDSLITLTDNTAGAYTSANINMAVAINQDASGFQYTNLASLQNGTPRLTQGMVRGYVTYPGSPGSNGFIYNLTDAQSGVYFYFGCNRTNYNEPQYLDAYWTTQNTSGASSIYPTQGSNNIDVSIITVGVGSAHSAGAQFRVPQNTSITSPFAGSWFFDVKVDLSWRINIGNVNDNIFCLWICQESDMINLIHSYTGVNLIKTADYFWQNSNSSTSTQYPFSLSESHISKIITLQCGSGSSFPSINVFMAVFRSADYNLANTFTIRSYDFINCCYSVLGIRAPLTGSTYPSLTRSTPGSLW